MLLVAKYHTSHMVSIIIGPTYHTSHISGILCKKLYQIGPTSDTSHMVSIPDIFPSFYELHVHLSQRQALLLLRYKPYIAKFFRKLECSKKNFAVGKCCLSAWSPSLEHMVSRCRAAARTTFQAGTVQPTAWAVSTAHCSLSNSNTAKASACGNSNDLQERQQTTSTSLCHNTNATQRKQTPMDLH